MKYRVQQVRSLIGATKRQRATLRYLGLGKIRREAVVEDTPTMRGAIEKVRHLVVVEEQQ